MLHTLKRHSHSDSHSSIVRYISKVENMGVQSISAQRPGWLLKINIAC